MRKRRTSIQDPSEITVIGGGGGGGSGEAVLEWGPDFGGTDGDHLEVSITPPQITALALYGGIEADIEPIISDLTIGFEDVIQVEGSVALNLGITPADFPQLDAFFDENNFLIDAFNVSAEGSVQGNFGLNYNLMSADLDTVIDELLADFEQYANSNDSTTGSWASASNALGNTTSTSATLSAASSGIGGITSNTSTGTITVGFADSTITDFDLDGTVTVNVERSIVSGGTLPLNQAVSASWEVSINGSSWTVIQADTDVVAKGIVSLDITSLVSTSWTNFDALQVRCVGSATSGTGLGATMTINFFRTWVELTATKTSGF